MHIVRFLVKVNEFDRTLDGVSSFPVGDLYVLIYTLHAIPAYQLNEPIIIAVRVSNMDVLKILLNEVGGIVSHFKEHDASLEVVLPRQ